MIRDIFDDTPVSAFWGKPAKRKRGKGRTYTPRLTPKRTPKEKYAAYLLSRHWLEFRELILATRGRKCERCGSKSRIQVHHKTYRRKGSELPEDVQVLCRACHQLMHPGWK